MSDNSEWKTLRVKESAWEQAKEQKEEAGRTWSEQIVRGSDEIGLDVDALEQAMNQISMANTPGVQIDTEEIIREVGKAVELAEQARDNTDEIKEKLK